MAELIAKTPLAGEPPFSAGGITLSELVPGPITSVAPYKGREAALNVALKTMGLSFPAPNEVQASGAARLVWTGRGQAFLIGTAAEDWGNLAALTDQSDGWAALSLSGAGAADVLARLVPLDLRAMQVGAVARSSLGHMSMILLRVDAGFELLVFRSMAQTAWHEITAAMKMLAARSAI